MNKLRSILNKGKGKKQEVIAPPADQADVASADAVAATDGSQMVIKINNRFNSNNVFAYITGQAIDNGNQVCLIKADRRSIYFPAPPPAIGTTLTEDVSIRLGGSGSTTEITIPRLAGARLWISLEKPLTFLTNPMPDGRPALVEPSISNPSDPNININWGFCEFTSNDGGIYANISYVDFVSIPIGLSLHDTNGNHQKVAGLKPDGLDVVCNGLESQGGDWAKLVYRADGRRLRALSPNTGIAMNGGNLFQGFYEPYVDKVWEKYTHTDLTLDTQNPAFGVLRGRVENGELVLRGGSTVAKFTKPNTRDVFGNSSGPFADNNGAQGPATARLCAAFNRSTLLINSVQPTEERRETFYRDSITNQYARLVHEANIDGRGYAFPYDDVPTRDSDESGFVNGQVREFIVTIG